jgi:glucokinase
MAQQAQQANLSLDSCMKPAVIGIDIGGTKTLCVLADHRCRLLEKLKFKTAPEKGCARFSRELLGATERLAKTAEKRKLRLACVGVGCAGRVDETQTISNSPNLLALDGFPLGKKLTQHLQTRVLIRNDVQMGIYGEFRLGAAKGSQTALGVFFGTGVGSAAVINGVVHTGASGMGGQVGALLAQPVGGWQAALSHGMVDRIASKAAIASEALVMAVKQWAPFLHRKVGTDLSKITWGVLEEAIRHGDKAVEDMMRARLKVVGIALSNVVNFLNPDMLVLGGGLVDTFPKLVHTELEGGMREYLTPEVDRALKVKGAKLGGDAVALGAAYAAMEDCGEIAG